ncbi:hypothetical protein [Pleionea sp. CnH1-48]|uniref:hypothetical protein n=1 Tax=Pleionea sp. CnH1-48 TaxID=2954494 RepID=UPI002096FD9A|nr:hypothetical protein [Pleionea sp. CnH1-48]MCO7222936.1 hypothetical protein [Pleionea sp. CnH1-48]
MKINRLLLLISGLAVCLLLSACSEESRNKWSRQADNLLGKDLKVSYIDGGTVVKSWTVKDGKVTSGKDEKGNATGYYYFWSVESGYVQLPIERTVIEEIKK